MDSSNKCPTCTVVNFICFWGDMPEKDWKRPFLFVLAALGLGGGSYLFYVSEHPSSQDPFTIALGGLLAGLLLLGLVVSLIGCNRCVARMFGDV